MEDLHDAMIRISWERVMQLCDVITQEIRLRHPSTDGLCIAGVEYGGLVPAAIIARGLGAKLAAVRPSGRDQPESKSLIIIDEICDTGETLEKLRRDCKRDAAFMVLHGRESTASIPDYTAEIIRGNEWVHYPWENYDVEGAHNSDAAGT